MKFPRTLPPFLLIFLALSSATAAPPSAESAPNAPLAAPDGPAAPEGAPSEEPASDSSASPVATAPRGEPAHDSAEAHLEGGTDTSSVAPPPNPPEQARAKPQVADERAPEKEPKIIKAEFGKGFTMGTADEKLTLNIRGRVQVQALAADGPEEGDAITQMQIRRMRLVFQGKLFGDLLQYYFQLGFSNRDQEPDLRMPLRDAYITFAPLRDLNLRFGQMKVPYGRQRVTSSSALGMVDRSIVTAELNLDRDVGLYAFSKDLFGLGGRLGYSLGVFGGDGRNRLAENAGFLYAARLNLTPFGAFEDNVESSYEREPDPRLAVGLSAAYNQATHRPQSTIGAPFSDPNVHFDYAHLGADAMFKWRGFFAAGEWFLRAGSPEEQTGEDAEGAPLTFVSRQAWGAFGQLGQMLTKHLELSARYGYIRPIGSVSAVPMTHEIGGGVSYYFVGHNLKLQADYFYFTNQADLSAGTQQGRLQAQVYF